MCFSRHKSPLLTLMLLIASFGSPPLFAAGVADKVTVIDPYVRAVPPVVKTSAAFLQLRNDAPTEHFVVGASSPIAGAVELHMHLHDNGVMRMRQIPHIHMPSGTNVALEPGGLHIMLFGLQSPLREGQEIPITLKFDDGSSKEIVAPVRSVNRMMKE